MNTHKNARLTPAGRAFVVRRVVEDHEAIRRVAEAVGVSARTVSKWLGRHRAEGPRGLLDRSSRPHRSPRALSPRHCRQIRQLRHARKSSLYIARTLALPLSTVVTVQRRLGLNRLSRLEPPRPIVRYERARPGELLHVDLKPLARIGPRRRTSPRLTGDPADRVRGGGWEYLHVAVDDCTRLTYAELLPTQRQEAVTRFLTRAHAWFRQHGIARLERVMTDNGRVYGSHPVQRLFDALGARHLRTRPYRPQTNGKVERVIQTLLREWAYAAPYHTSRARRLALGRYLTYYNTQRPHTALNFTAPQHRLIAVNNVLVNDT